MMRCALCVRLILVRAMSVAVVLTLSALAYAKDWQTGTIEVHPAVVRDMFADYKGHLYRESQLGYTCMDGDADNAPVCISDEDRLIVAKSGDTTFTLADGTRFVVPDYTQAGEIYSPSLTVSRDEECRLGIYRPLKNDDYQCTIFKRLSLMLDRWPRTVLDRSQPDELKALAILTPPLPTCGGSDDKGTNLKKTSPLPPSTTFPLWPHTFRKWGQETTITSGWHSCCF